MIRLTGTRVHILGVVVCFIYSLHQSTETAVAQGQFRVPSFATFGDKYDAEPPLQLVTHRTNSFSPLEDEGSGTEGDDQSETIAGLTERMAEMEESWGKYQDKIAKDAADKKSKSSYKITGRVHFDYWNFINNSPGIGYFENDDPAEPETFGNDPEDRWLFRRIRLEMQGNVPQGMRFRFQIDFNNPSSPEYKDVYIGWDNLPYNQSLLIGNQKRPMGMDHLNSSRFNVFIERPFAVETFNEDARRVGLAMYGHSDDESRFWTYGVYSLENTSRSGRLIGDSTQGSFNFRYGGSPWYDETSGGRGYWHTAVSGMVAKPDGDNFAGDTNSNDGRFRTRPLARSSSRWLNTDRIAGADWYETAGVESVLNIGSLQLTGEYYNTWMQRDDTTPGTGSDVNFHGGYVFLSYFLTGEHVPYKRKAGVIDRVRPHENFFLVDRWCGKHSKRGMGAWLVGLRYDYLDLSDHDVQGGVGQSVTGALNWHWTAYSKLQTNLIYGEIDQHRPVNGFTSGDYWIYGMRFMIDF